MASVATPDIHLWVLPRDGAAREALCKEAPGVLSPEEQKVHRAITRPDSARRYLLGRILLRRALGQHLGCSPQKVSLIVSPNGKILADQAGAAGLDFSLSHTMLESVLAVAPARGLGIDIELLERAPTVHRIGTRFFAEPERLCIQGQGPQAADFALSLWTLKEAAVKAVGSTIWRGLDEFRFDVRGEKPVWLSPPPQSSMRDWLLALGRFGHHHRLAVALYLPGARSRDFGWSSHVVGGGEIPQGELELTISAGH